jgi:hypothetical protein
MKKEETGNREGNSAAAPRWRRYGGPALVLLAALVAITPLIVRGPSCGHDFNVHLVSWFDAQNSWRHGIPYPHWTPSPNYGAGEPRFVFYPPLTWMLGAALGLVLPWSFVPIALTFLIYAGAGLATRALALEALDDAAATLAGCAAIFSGFSLFTGYERTAYPEFAGGFWIPLLLLFALRSRRPTATLFRRACDGSTVPLAIALAGAWLSNAPLGVMASYLLAAVALAAALLNRDFAPALRGALAAVLGLGITAFFWLPAALERRWVDIRQATEDPGYNFENSWLFAHHANPLLALHDVVLHRASIIAVTMIAIAVAGLAVSWLRGTLSAQKSTASRLWWIPLALIPVVVFFLLFPISRPVWYLLPEMRYLQYPWRWLEAVEAPMAIFFAAAVWPASKKSRWAVGVACTVAFVAATAYAATSFFQVCYPEDTVPATLAAYRAHMGFEGLYEYEPPGADETLIAKGLPDACLVSNPATTLGQPVDADENPAWNAAQGSCEVTYATNHEHAEHLHFHAAVPHPGFIILRLLSYPAWQIRVNGRIVSNLPKRDDGLIAVPVPEGRVVVSAKWSSTPDVIASRWISAIALCFLVLLWFVERRERSRGPAHLS